MYRVYVKTDDLEKGITGLNEFAGDKTAVMRGIAGVFAESVERGFATESDPVTGEAWAPLSDVTKARRAKAGHTGKILQVSGADGLAGSFDRAYGQDFASIGTAKEYATTMHFGAKQGQFGSASALSNRRVFQMPWGDIPGRYLLPVGPNGEMNSIDEEEMQAIIINALEAVFNG